MSDQTSVPDYYYDGRTRVHFELDRTNAVVIDGERAARLLGDGRMSEIQVEGDELLHGLILFEPGVLAPEEIERLEEGGALLLTFVMGGVRAVILPELFIYCSDKDQKALIERLGSRITILARDTDYLKVRVTSGRSDDALLIANELTEQMSGVTAAPHFLRLRMP